MKQVLYSLSPITLKQKQLLRVLYKQFKLSAKSIDQLNRDQASRTINNLLHKKRAQ